MLRFPARDIVDSEDECVKIERAVCGIPFSLVIVPGTRAAHGINWLLGSRSAMTHGDLPAVVEPAVPLYSTRQVSPESHKCTQLRRSSGLTRELAGGNVPRDMIYNGLTCHSIPREDRLQSLYPNVRPWKLRLPPNQTHVRVGPGIQKRGLEPYREGFAQGLSPYHLPTISWYAGKNQRGVARTHHEDYRTLDQL